MIGNSSNSQDESIVVCVRVCVNRMVVEFIGWGGAVHVRDPGL